MTVWLLFAHHYRQIYRYKLHRIQELEESLEMVQHRRFEVEFGPQYKAFGPKGHKLDAWMYSLSSLGGPFVGCVTVGFNWMYLCSVLVVLVALRVFWINDAKVDSTIRSLRSGSTLTDTRSPRVASLAASILLALAAAAQFVRVMFRVDATVAGLAIPAWASAVGGVLAGAVAVLVWNERRKE